jgi:hypothetical protein
VVMRMLPPPLLTVVVDRSSAPGMHGSKLSRAILMIRLRGRGQRHVRPSATVWQRVGAGDMRARCMRQMPDASSPGKTPSAEVDDSTEGVNRLLCVAVLPALRITVPMTTRAASCSRRTPTAAARRHCLLHDALCNPR